MYKTNDLLISSIGVSCIVEHQIQNSFSSRSGGFFDYITIIPDALINILEKYEKNKNFDFLIKPNNYESVEVGTYIVPFHKEINGLVLNYESLDDQLSFESKKKHQFDNFVFNKKNIFIWSNLQSNICQSAYEFGLIVEDFYLTQDRYDKISRLIDVNWKGECIFIVRQEYCDKSVLSQKNVHVLELKNYTGFTENLYHLGPDKFFNSIIDQYI